MEVLRGGRLDSAVVLLRSSLDASGHPTRDDQVQAWLLLSVIAFYKGTMRERVPIFSTAGPDPCRV